MSGWGDKRLALPDVIAQSVGFIGTVPFDPRVQVKPDADPPGGR